MSEELPWRYACVCRNTKEGEIALLCEMGVEGIWRKAKQRCLWSHLASFNRFFSILWNLYPVTFLSSLSPFHFLSYKVQIHVQCRWCRNMGLILGLGRFPGGCGNPPQYSCLENPMRRGAWWATVHRVPKSWTWLKGLSIHAAQSMNYPELLCGNDSSQNVEWSRGTFGKNEQGSLSS